MLDFNDSPKDCTGCGACYNACPVKCISMQEDEEGFLYPQANANCIQCGLCKKVCPVINSINNPLYDKQECYAAITKDMGLWLKSTSGGAFSEICNAFGDDDTLIVGAAWNDLEVKHICIRGIKNIAPLRKSKYIESPTGETFIKAKEVLQLGGKVIYSGTPCQIAGLKKFLRKDYKNLLTIDLICHGVGSPLVFKNCVELFEEQNSDKVLSYEFRTKRNKYETDHISCIHTTKSKRLYSLDRYNQLFLEQLCVRPSCGENCKFRNQSRQGDITIADFKGLKHIFPYLVANCTNYSTIVFNTNKSSGIKEVLSHKLDLYSCDIKDIIRFNPLFAGHTWSNKNRDIFFKDFQNNSKAAILKWTNDDTLFCCHPKIKLFNSMPKVIRKMAISLIKR